MAFVLTNHENVVSHKVTSVEDGETKDQGASCHVCSLILSLKGIWDSYYVPDTTPGAGERTENETKLQSSRALLSVFLTLSQILPLTQNHLQTYRYSSLHRFQT